MIKAYSIYNINLHPSFVLNILGKIFDKRLNKKNYYIEEFEKNFSSFIGVKYSVGVSSARFGLYLLFAALKFNRGEEIILSAYNFYVIPQIILNFGLQPLFVDTEENSYNINPFLIEERITDKTRAIIATHMFGHPCNMDIILKMCAKYNLMLIEDCTHACGASYKDKKIGSFGDASIFSFDLGKVLTCFGGGMLLFKNEFLYKTVKEIARNYSELPKIFVFKRILQGALYSILLKKNLFPFLLYPILRLFDYLNFNLKKLIIKKPNLDSYSLSGRYKRLLSSFQAKIGIIQLKNLDKIIVRLNENANQLNSLLASLENMRILKCTDRDSFRVYSHYHILVEKRSLFIRNLLHRRIFSFADENMVAYSNINFPSKVAQRLSQQILEIPNNIFLNNSDIAYIAEQIKIVNREINEED